MRDNFTLWKEKLTFVWVSQWEYPKNWRYLLESVQDKVKANRKELS